MIFFSLTITFYLLIKKNDAEPGYGAVCTDILCRHLPQALGSGPEVSVLVSGWGWGFTIFWIQSPVMGVMMGTEDKGRRLLPVRGSSAE